MRLIDKHAHATRQAIPRWIATHPVATLVGVFTASRLYYWAIGIRFDDSTIVNFMQILDSRWLQERLAETLFYTHSQPPLLNLLIGVVLKLSARHATALFALIFLALGLLLIISLHQLMLELRVPPALALITSVLFCVSPATIIYENWLFYTYPVTSLLTAAFWLFSRFSRRGAWLDGLLCSGLLAAVALFRAPYHLAWVIGLIALAWMFSPRATAWAKILMLLPCLLVFGWCLKNLLVFGSFSASSWFGMNWYTPIAKYFPATSRDVLVAEGRLRVTALPWLPLTAYGEYTARPEFEGIPSLTATQKTSGVPNFNHYAYIEISQRFMHDDLIILRECPICYSRAVAEAIQVYLRSATDDIILYYSLNNMTVTAPIRWVFDNVLYGRALSLVISGANDWGGDAYPVLLVGIPTVLAASGLILLGLLWRQDDLAGPLLGVWLTSMFISAAYCSADLLENNRYRYEVDPLLFSLAVFVAWQAYQRFRRPSRTRIAPERNTV